MSATTIQEKTVVEALDRPSTLKAMGRKTGYPVGRLLSLIVTARGHGVGIKAHARKDEATYYTRES